MKKVLALVLAAMMALALCGTAFAALPKDDIVINGLQAGDEVTLYNVIYWDTDAGNWAVNDDFTAVSSNVADYTGSNMNQSLAADIADQAASATVLAGPTSVTGTSYTYNAEPGMYLALVKAGGEYIYNPMILSVNWVGEAAEGVTLSELQSSEAYGTTGRAKKTPVDFDKEVEDIGEDKYDATTDGDTWFTVTEGDHIPFKVTSTVPAYAENYTDPYYAISDKLSAGLTLDQDSIKVTIGGVVMIEDGEYVTGKADNFDSFTKDDDEYFISLSAGFLHEMTTNANIVIEYTAEVGDFLNGSNVTKLDNEAKVEFSNNPHDTDEHGTKYDRTHHYTFAIDADATGTDSGSWITSELIKIGVSEGVEVSEWRVTDSGTWASQTKLDGATFKLKGIAGTTTADYEETYTTQNGTGHISFYNLEAGEYELTEVSAPAGYVKSNEVVRIKIETTMKDNLVTMPDGYQFTEQILDTYTISMNVDGKGWQVKDSYTYTNEGSTIHTSQDATNLTHPFLNTQGTELPSTGGIGTTIFYVTGLLMVLGAGTVLVARRKADEE